MEREISKSMISRVLPIGVRLEVIAAIIWLFFSFLITVFTPIGAGPDEPMHIARAAQIASGIFLPQDVTDSISDCQLVRPLNPSYRVYGGAEDAALYECSVRGNLLFRQGSAKPERPFSFPYWTDSQFSGEEADELNETVVWAFPNTAINSPLCYFPHAIGYNIASLLNLGPVGTGIIMRVFGSIAFAVLMAIAVRIAPVGKSLIFVLFFCPLSLLVNSFVTADSLAIASATLFISTIFSVFHTRKFHTTHVVLLVISGLGLALGKMTYLPLGLLLLALPITCKELRTKRNARIIISICLMAIVAFSVWYALIREVNTGVIWSADINPDAQLEHIIANPLSFIEAFIKLMTGLDLFALSSDFSLYYPAWLTCLAYFCAFIIEFGVDNPPKKLKGGFALSLAAFLAWVIILILIAIALYLQFNPVGSSNIAGVQTRYSLPILLLPMLALLQGIPPLHGCTPLSDGREQAVIGNHCCKIGILAPCLLMAALTALGMCVRIYT